MSPSASSRQPAAGDFKPGRHRTQNWTLGKPAAQGGKGVVVSQSADAAQAGIAVLQAGGNAADAAVATALALAAVEPWNSGLGGIGFAVVLPAGSRDAQVVDFGPVSPAATDPSRFPLTGRAKQDLFTWPEVEGDRNIHGPLSFCVPSAPAGYAALKRHFGTAMPLAEVMAPAVSLARRGLPQDWYTTLKVAASASVLRLYPESARLYLPDGLPPVAPYQGVPGFLPLGRLADTLAQLARAGLEDFYTGEVAQALAADLAEHDAMLGPTDLAACQAVLRASPTIDWRGRHRLHTAGGLTAAPTLQAVIEGMREATLSPAGPDAAWFAQLSRVLRQAYAERLGTLGAAAQVSEPVDACTTHLSVVDGEGMMVAMTTTLLSSMGSRVVLGRSGVLMNNGMMWFDPTPGSANAMRPGARPLCNMCPVLVTPSDGGWPRLAVGASGGRRILASVYQLLAWGLDFGLSPEQATHQPRIDVSGPDMTTADDRLDGAVLQALAADGPVELVEHSVLPINFACPSLLRTDGKIAEACSDAASPWSAALSA